MISEDFNSEYDFIELKSYLCVRYPKQCIEIWQRWVTYSRLIPMTRSMRTKNGCDNTGVYRWSRKSAPTRRSGRSGNNSWQARQRRRTGSGQIQQRRARLARAGRTRRAVPDQGGAPGIHPRQNRHPGRTVSRYNGSPGTGDVRGPARRGSRVTQVVQPYHATATNHQATGNEEGHVEGGTGKTIVDMYNNGYSIDDIWEVSGFNSKSSIWRVLNKYGVYLNRGRTSGPRVKKQQDETK